MYLRLGPTAAVFAALVFGALATQALHAQGGSAVRISGDATALQLDVHQATLADVLTALGQFNVRYRSQSALNGTIDGTYAGSLGHVLTRVLDGYNYAIKQSDSTREVIVIGRSGQQVPPGPAMVPVRKRSSE
jgi:hypothetical protein